MQCTIGLGKGQWEWMTVAHTIGVIGLVVLALLGNKVESSSGWIACPPQWVRIEAPKRRGRRYADSPGFAWSAGWS
jgi:hypothetical protein